MGAAEVDVLRAFDDLDRACNGTDANAITRLFVDDPNITFWGSAVSERAVGPAQMRVLAAAVVGTTGSFRIEWGERRVSIEGEVAWVNATGVARWDPGDGGVKELPYRLTGILLHRDGAWLWHTCNGSEPQPD